MMTSQNNRLPLTSYQVVEAKIRVWLTKEEQGQLEWLEQLERRQREQEPARRQRAIDSAQRAHEMSHKVLL